MKNIFKKTCKYKGDKKQAKGRNRFRQCFNIYKGYRPNCRWIITELLKIATLWGVVSYLMFDSFVGLIPSIPLVLTFYYYDLKDYHVKQHNKMLRDFKEVITLVSGNLNAGYSLENSWIMAGKEFVNVFGNDNQMAEEIEIIAHGLSVKQSLTFMLRCLAAKSGINEIGEFANVMEIANKYGGNSSMIIRQTCLNMTDRNAVSEEIETLIASKKMEGRILLAMPFIMIAYMKLTNPGYIEIMYETMLGRIIMCFCILTIIACEIWMKRIMKIN